MRSLTIKNASHDLSSLIDYSLKTHEELSIASDNGAVIMLPQDDYESMLETLRLLSDKKSLKALLDVHQARKDKVTLECYSVKDVFGDL